MSSSLGPRRILATPGLRVLYLWTFLSKLSVLAPFLTIFLAHRVGVGTAEIALLFATYSAMRVLSEVPLGMLADRIGETPTLRTSSALALAGVACLAFGPLPALFLGQALFALFESASSGVQAVQRRKREWPSRLSSGAAGLHLRRMDRSRCCRRARHVGGNRVAGIAWGHCGRRGGRRLPAFAAPASRACST